MNRKSESSTELDPCRTDVGVEGEKRNKCVFLCSFGRLMRIINFNSVENGKIVFRAKFRSDSRTVDGYVLPSPGGYYQSNAVE